MQEYKGRREGIYLIRGVIMQVYKRNTIRMIEAYYGNTTGINGMDIRGILEQSPNIPKRESFFLSVYTENENDSPDAMITDVYSLMMHL